ncbi:MAG: ATP cone domain-containing protein [Candidatus Altiarchaeota archaeon]|nr:ATP cone domain-containing protein [Candidatus Altiarchaeota archaeon]
MVLIRKQSGEAEEFDPNKVKGAIIRAGASEEIADKIVAGVEKRIHPGVSTAEIYHLAFQLLDHEKPAAATRFGLKEAIMRLGPTGYPFEKFMGSVLSEYGYTVELNRMIEGKCVTHEVDLVLTDKDGKRYMVECKYHNNKGFKTGIKETLYTYARFLDLKEGSVLGKCENFDGVWLVCNTKISGEGITYGNCRGMKILAWGYPEGGSIQQMIEGKGIYPITILRSVDGTVKDRLSKAGIMLLRELLSYDPKELVVKTGLPEKKIETMLAEVRSLYSP